MADFKIAHEKTKLSEGFYDDNPKDRGGETVCGIARNRWPQWPVVEDDGTLRSDKNIWDFVDMLKHDSDFPENLKQEEVFIRQQADAFYKREFWDRIYGDKISSQPLADLLYDTGVNQGSASPVKFLQESLNFSNRGQKDFKDIAADGVMGDITIYAIQRYIAKRGQRGFYALILSIMSGGIERWKDIVRNDESQEEFYNGWMNRAIDNAYSIIQDHLAKRD